MAATTGHNINTWPYGENIYKIVITSSNQRLSRACIVHLVIKRTNWSYVKTMSCRGGHLGIPINIKNTKFVKDLPMIDAQFRFNQCNSFRESLVLVFNPTFNNISIISWRSVLLMEDTGVSGVNHRPLPSHWQTLSHNVVSSTPRHVHGSKSQR
jgi:hypothetical protein